MDARRAKTKDMNAPDGHVDSGLGRGWLAALAPAVVLWALLLSGCGGPASDGGRELERTERALRATQTALAGSDRPSRTPPPTKSPADPASTASAPSGTTGTPLPECADLADQVGRTVTCVIGQAHCSYRKDIDGAPTFCNDAPYPTHDFTLLVWGQDWSDFDGRCLVVSGFLSRFEGQPQIVAESRSQVSICD